MIKILYLNTWFKIYDIIQIYYNTEDIILITQKLILDTC